MIARLRGKLIATQPICVVDVGGVGFEVQVPDKDRLALGAGGDDVSFYTYLYVREDRLVLFGFLRAEDRELFGRLIEVSGIGPKIAVGMLGEHPTGRIVAAIREGDVSFLQRLPGLGKKTAQRLSVELKDKLDHLATEPARSRGAAASVREEAMLALTSLGMQRGAAEKALDRVDWKDVESRSVPDIVKEALRHASGA